MKCQLKPKTARFCHNPFAVWSMLATLSVMCAPQVFASNLPVSLPPSSFGANVTLSLYGSGTNFYNYASPNGGQNLTSDSQMPVLSPAMPNTPAPTMSAAANLGNGTLSATLNDGNGSDMMSANAQMWDTLTFFQKNPLQGSSQSTGTLTWNVNASMTQPSQWGTTYNNVSGYACLEINAFLCGGPNAYYNLAFMYGVPQSQFAYNQFYGKSGQFATPLSVSFPLTQGGSITLDAVLSGNTAGGGSISLDPPLKLSLPAGWSYTSASNTFLGMPAVPEPADWLVLSIGIMSIVVIRRHKSS